MSKKIDKIKIVRASYIPNPATNASDYKDVMEMSVYKLFQRGLQYATEYQYYAVIHTFRLICT